MTVADRKRILFVLNSLEGGGAVMKILMRCSEE